MRWKETATERSDAVPVLVICAHRDGHVGVVEDDQCLVRLGADGAALDVLVTAEANIDRWIARLLKQSSARVLAEYALAESTKLLPVEAPVLIIPQVNIPRSTWQDAVLRTMKCLFRIAEGKFP
jgi:hypothetical protein